MMQPTIYKAAVIINYNKDRGKISSKPTDIIIVVPI